MMKERRILVESGEALDIGDMKERLDVYKRQILDHGIKFDPDSAA